MVDNAGHVAMGLLWAVPAWAVFSWRRSLLFAALTGLGAVVPDVDRWLNALFPTLVHHHGVTHTVVFVVLSSVLFGTTVTTVFGTSIDRSLGGHRFDASGLFWFVTGAFCLGGASHLFADMLSAPDISQPIEPFWPLLDKPWSINLLWYDSSLWNVGLLAVALSAHLVVAAVSRSVETDTGFAGQ